MSVRQAVGIAFLMSITLATPALGLAPAGVLPPEDPFVLAREALRLAEGTGALAPGVARVASAAFDLAEATDPRFSHRLLAAAHLADGTAGELPQATQAFAEKYAAILDLAQATDPGSRVGVVQLASAIWALDAPPVELPLDQSPSVGEAFDLYRTTRGLPPDPSTRATLESAPFATREGLRIVFDATTRSFLASREALLLERPEIIQAAKAALTRDLERAIPLLVAVSGHGPLVDCESHDIRLGADDDVHDECVLSPPIMIDLGGDDTYPYGAGSGEYAVDSGICVGDPSDVNVHIVLDAAGNDTYEEFRSNTYGLGSIDLGLVAMYDLGGDDLYRTSSERFAASPCLDIIRGESIPELPRCDPETDLVCQIARTRITSPNPYWAATFVDLAGDDVYGGLVTEARYGGPDGFGLGRGAVFIDGNGDDTFGAVRGAGSNLGVAIDLGGSDTWKGSSANDGGLFADLGQGDDVYDFIWLNTADTTTLTRFPSLKGPPRFGGPVAVFVDDGGDNRLEGSFNVATLESLAVADLGPGQDIVRCPVGCAFASQASTAVLLDHGGVNHFGTTDRGQASAENQSLALIVDRGRSTYDFAPLDPGTGGQGSATLASVGLILQTLGNVETVYRAGEGALPLLAIGGGVGMRVNRGSVVLEGEEPNFACGESSTTIASAPTLIVLDRELGGLTVCSPDPEAIPPSGPGPFEWLGIELPRQLDHPGVPCRTDPILVMLGCEALVTSLLWEPAVDRMEADHTAFTTNGGLSTMSGAGLFAAKVETASADSACQVYCVVFERSDAIG